MLFSLFSKPFSFFDKTFFPKELANPQRILITHFGSTAEIVRSLPLLVAMRHRFPYADIAWLIEEKAAPLVLDHWAINRFIIVRHDWYKRFSELRRVRHRLQSFSPQVAVDPQNSFGSSLATWFSGATYRIGFGNEQSRYLHNVYITSDEPHQIERNLQLLQPFGIFGCDVGFDLPECEKDRLAAQNIRHRKGVPDDFALLHISTDKSSSRWHEDRYATLAKYLFNTWNLPSLITWSGGEEESRRAESIVHTASGAAVQAPWTSLSERQSLSKLATIFVGSDTAELQIAAAVGTKCVGLFGPTSALENAPLGKEHRTIQVHGFKKQRRGSLSVWMDTITPELVCKKCDEVLTEISRLNVMVPMEFPSVQKKAA